jgi:sugar phosphate isomerase/epimerase
MGISGIEIAPSIIWEKPFELEPREIEEFLLKIRGAGLGVSGLQSVLFNNPQLTLFNKDKWDELRVHLSYIIDLCSRLESNIIVFGSPKNRIRGKLSLVQANEMAAEFFQSLELKLSEREVILSIEPNAAIYGSDWITTYSEAVEFTDTLNSNWIKPQIDTGSQIASGENVLAAYKTHLPSHIHISDLNLSGLSQDSFHQDFANLIEISEYDGWVVLEMLSNKSIDRSFDSTSFENFLIAYG